VKKLLFIVLVIAFCTNKEKRESRENPVVKEIIELSRYGNYCGDGHKTGAPVDSLDQLCSDHDMCFRGKGKTYLNEPICNSEELYECDKVLLEDLIGLDSDSTLWEYKPVDNKLAENYRLAAIGLFEACTKYKELQDLIAGWKEYAGE